VNTRTSPSPPPIFSGGASRRGFAALLSFFCLFLLAPTLRAADLAHLQSLVSQLASDDPLLRENALGDLMDLKCRDLPMLRAAALSQSPLLPSQIAGLRQIVTQVFLAGEKYKVDPSDSGGFMGIQFSRNEPLVQNDGVVVMDRIKGFPAYRHLHSGDMILKLLDRPGVQLNDANEFINAVKSFHSGDIVRLGVLRYGRAIEVSVPLVDRPIELAGNPSESMVDAWIQAREKRAEAYWNAEFSILDPASAPSASQASMSVEP
jgi:hypothetical protein